MNITKTALLTVLGFLLALQAASDCTAENLPDPSVPVVAGAHISGSEFGEAISATVLEQESGGQATEIDKIYLQLTNSQMKADLNNNNLDSHSTGANILSGSAFSNMNGFATVIQNSGNQVIIQSDLIVNVTVH